MGHIRRTRTEFDRLVGGSLSLKLEGEAGIQERGQERALK